MAAFQMVHVMEGVIIRGTATVLRDLNRPLFGKTGTTNGPTNVWFVGGTPDIVAGVYLGYDQPHPMGQAQGGRIAAPIWKQWALTALKDEPKVPFVAPPGIRWVRIDRASGKPVFGAFPTTEDPKSAVIWEAFQPQTEAVHSQKSTFGDPYSPQYLQLWQQAAQQQPPQLKAQQQQRPGPGAAPRPPVATAPQPQPAACQPRTRSSRRSRSRFPKRFEHARRSAGPYRTDQCRDRAAAPVPRLGPGAQAARGAQRAGRGPVALGRSKAAQDVMRERRRLEEAIGATRTIERELADTRS